MGEGFALKGELRRLRAMQIHNECSAIRHVR
jgi:hypothetical protein